MTQCGEEVRAAWPQLSDEEFIELTREEEVAVALIRYLRQRKLGEVEEGEEKLFEHNPNFPFPFIDTAYEIARVVLGSANSFGYEQPAEPSTLHPSP